MSEVIDESLIDEAFPLFQADLENEATEWEDAHIKYYKDKDDDGVEAAANLEDSSTVPAQS